jgi:glycosyltransferase involved in cell wall biosynthesis
VKTIVSVTPIAVERDSRTFKQASSMARMGYRSVVFEVQPSHGLSDNLPFELMTLGCGASSEPPTERPVQPTGVDGVPFAVGPDDAAAAGEPESAREDRRSAIVRMIDDLATLAPSPLRTLLGPAWRRLLWRLQVNELVVFKSLLGAYLETCRATAAELPAADLYYLHAQSQFPAVWWRSRRAGVPFVYDAHDLYSLMRHNGARMRPAADAMWRLWDVMEREAARRASVCVTVGAGVAAHAEAQFGRRFEVVRNAHDPSLDEPAPADLRTSLGLDGSALLVAVVGNFKPEFLAVRPLLEALQRLPAGVHVAFVGAHYEEPARWVEELGVADRVHFRPAVAPTRIVPLLSAADVAPILYHPVNPDIRNALPNKLFQAIAAGVPVLYGRHLTDLRQLCEQHELGWEFDPENTASVIVALGRLHDRRDELEQRRAHVAAVRDRLSWANEEPALARILAGALDRGGSA